MTSLEPSAAPSQARLWCVVAWALDPGEDPRRGLGRLRAQLDRARALGPAARTIVVVLEQERPWWRRLLEGHPGANVVEQPFDRGSGTAVLVGGLAVQRRDPDARIHVLGREEWVGSVGALVESFRTRAPETARQCAERLRDGPQIAGALDGLYPHLACVQFAFVRPRPAAERVERAVVK